MEDKCKKCSAVSTFITTDRSSFTKQEIVILAEYFCNLSAESYCSCIFENRLKLAKVNIVFQCIIDSMLNNLKLFSQLSEKECDSTCKPWNLLEILELIECVTKIFSMTFILNIPSKQIGTVNASDISSDILLSLQTYCIIPKTIPFILLQNICYFCDFRGFSILKLIFSLEPSPAITSLACAIIKMLVLIIDWLDPRFLPNDYNSMRCAMLQFVLKMDPAIISKPLKSDRLLISANTNRNAVPMKNISSQSQISMHDVSKYNLVDLAWLCCKIEFNNQWTNYERDVLLTFSSEIVLDSFIDMVDFLLKLIRFENPTIKVSAVTNLLNLIQMCMDLDNQLIWLGFIGCFSVHLSRYILDQQILPLIFYPDQHPEVSRVAEPILKYFNFIESRSLQNLASVAKAYRVIGVLDSNKEVSNNQTYISTDNSCKSLIGVDYFKHIIIQCGLHAMIAFNMEVLNKLPTEEITEETLYISQFLSKQMWLFHLKSEMLFNKRKQVDSLSSTEHKDSPFDNGSSSQLMLPHEEYSSEYTANYDSIIQDSERPASSEASWGSKKNVSIDDETFSDALLNSPSLSQSDLMLPFHDFPVDDEFRNLVENKFSGCSTLKEYNDSVQYFREFENDLDNEETHVKNKAQRITYDSSLAFDKDISRKRKHDCDKDCCLESKSKIIRKFDSNINMLIKVPQKSLEAEDLFSKSKYHSRLKRSHSVPSLYSDSTEIEHQTPTTSRKVKKIFDENEPQNRPFSNSDFLQKINQCNPNLLQIVVQICDANANNNSTVSVDSNQPGTSCRDVTLFQNLNSHFEFLSDRFSKPKQSSFIENKDVNQCVEKKSNLARSKKGNNNLRILHSFLRDNVSNTSCNKMFTNICCAGYSGDTCDQNMGTFQSVEEDLSRDDDCRSTSRSSSSTEDEEIVANKLLEASFYDCLAKPGYTLLWDVLSEKRYALLSPMCKMLAPRLLLQMLESFDEDNIRLLFLTGCIDNLVSGHSKTIFLKLMGPIIRFLNPCRDVKSPFRQFLKSKNVIQILLKDLVTFELSIGDKLATFDKDHPPINLDRTQSEVLDDIVLRLEIIGLIITEANNGINQDDDTVRANNEADIDEMIDTIWQTLIKNMPSFVTDVTFSWWLSLFKESNYIFTLKNVKHILEDRFPTIPPSNLTIMALDFYQYLIKKYKDVDLLLSKWIESNFIWQAAVYSENADVSVMAIKINSMILIEYLKQNVNRLSLESISEEFDCIIKAKVGTVNNERSSAMIISYLSKCICSLKNGVDILKDISYKPQVDGEHIIGAVLRTVDNVLITLQRIINILHSLLSEFTKYFAYSLTSKLLEIGQEPHYAMCSIDSKWNWIQPLYPKSQEISISLILNDKKILLRYFSHQIFGSVRAEATCLYNRILRTPSTNPTISNPCYLVRLYLDSVEMKPENDFKCIQMLNICDGCSIMVVGCDISLKTHYQIIKSELASSKTSLQVPDCYLPNITDSPYNIYTILSSSEYFEVFNDEIFHNLMILLHNIERPSTLSTSTKYRLWLLTRYMIEIIYLLSIWKGPDHKFIQAVLSVKSFEDLKAIYDFDKPQSLIINLRLTQNICQGCYTFLTPQQFFTILQNYNGLTVIINLIQRINETFQARFERFCFWLLDTFGCLLEILYYISKCDPSVNWELYVQRGDLPVVLFNLSVILAHEIHQSSTSNKQQLQIDTEIDCLKLIIRLMSTIPGNGISRIVDDDNLKLPNWIKMIIVDCPIKQLRRDAVNFLSKVCDRDSRMSLVVFKSAVINLNTASSKNQLISISKSDLDNYKNKVGIIKDETCDHSYFDLLRIIVDYFQHDLETYECGLSTIDLIVRIIDERSIFEKRPIKCEDVILIGLMKVLRRLVTFLMTCPLANSKFFSLMKNVVHKIFDWLFNINNSSPLVANYVIPMRFFDLQKNLLPKFKGHLLRLLVFEILLDFCQIPGESFQTICDKIVELHINRSSVDDYKSFPLEYWPREDLREETGFCGIINLGATCYMATTLQHLFMIPEIRKLILESADPGMKWFNKLQSIFTFLQFSERSGLNPKPFCDAYEMNKQVINTGEQKDMSEFFSDLIAKLETVSPPLKVGIKFLLGGESSSYIVSLDCPHQSRIPEEFYFLSLNVNNMTNLQQSFAHFVEKDILDGNNKYRCSDCNSLVRAEKRTCLTKLPGILCLNIMRYYFDVNTLRREKLNNFFEFPMQLDVEPFMKHWLISGENDPKVKGNYRYKLIGITVHSGTSESGHYYNFIKDRSDGRPLFWDDPNTGYDKWYCFNDSKVKSFDPLNIPAECFGGLNCGKKNLENSQLFLNTSEFKTNNAYMLFYERVAEDNVNWETKSLNISIPHSLHSSIDSDNKIFLRDCLLFDLSYFQFLLQFGTNVPRLISKPNSDVSVAANIAKVSASFILEVLLHSREKPELSQWVELLFRVISSCRQAQFWLIDFITSKNKWIHQYLFLCTDKIVRNLFIKFLQELAKLLLVDCHKTVNCDVTTKQIKHLVISLLDALEATAYDVNNLSSINFKLNQFEDPILPCVGRSTFIHCATSGGNNSRFFCNTFPDMLENFFDLLLSLIKINNNIMLPIILKCGVLHRLIFFYLNIRLCDSETVVCLKQSRHQKHSELQPLLQSSLKIVDCLSFIDNEQFSRSIIQYISQTQIEIAFNPKTKNYLDNLLIIIVDILSHLSQKSTSDDSPSLSKHDAVALLSEHFIKSNFSLSTDPCQSMPFLYHQICDGINPSYTLKLLALLIAYRREILPPMICFLMLSASIQSDPIRCQNFLYYIDIMIKLEKRMKVSTSSDRVILPSRPIEDVVITKCIEFTLASQCPFQWLNWMCTRCSDTALVHHLMIHLDDWVFRFIFLDPNGRVRQSTRDLIRTMLKTSQDSDSDSSDESLHETDIQQNLYLKLLSLLPEIRKRRCSQNQIPNSEWLNPSGSSSSDVHISEPCRQEDHLAAFFNSLNDALLSESDKIKANEFMPDLWAIYHPGMSVALCPINWEKQSLLLFLYRVCSNNPSAIEFLTKTPSISIQISTNYILSDLEDPTVVLFNRKMLPHFFGVLTLCCQQSQTFRLSLCHKCDTIDWCYRHILPHRQYYGSVIDDIISLTEAMLEPVTYTQTSSKEESGLSQSKFRRRFLRKNMTTELRSKLLLKLCSMFIQDNEDRLNLVMHDGFFAICLAAIDLVNKYSSNNIQETEKPVVEILTIITQVVRYCLLVIEQGNGQSLRRDIFYRSQGRFKSQMLELATKLLHLICSDSSRYIRVASIECVRQVLDVYQKDFLTTITKELLTLQNKVNIDIIVHRDIPLSMRIISNSTIESDPQKMNTEDTKIDASSSVRLAEDKAMLSYFSLVDRVSRMAVNLHRFNSDSMTLCLTTAIQSYPMCCPLFAQFSLEILHSDLITEESVEHMMTSSLFHDYISLLLSGDSKYILREKAIFQLLEDVFPKIGNNLITRLECEQVTLRVLDILSNNLLAFNSVECLVSFNNAEHFLTIVYIFFQYPEMEAFTNKVRHALNNTAQNNDLSSTTVSSIHYLFAKGPSGIKHKLAKLMINNDVAAEFSGETKCVTNAETVKWTEHCKYVKSLLEKISQVIGSIKP